MDLKVREDVVRGLYLEGVTEEYVASREEIYDLMRRGSANRCEPWQIIVLAVLNLTDTRHMRRCWILLCD